MLMQQEERDLVSSYSTSERDHTHTHTHTDTYRHTPGLLWSVIMKGSCYRTGTLGLLLFDTSGEEDKLA